MSKHVLLNFSTLTKINKSLFGRGLNGLQKLIETRDLVVIASNQIWYSTRWAELAACTTALASTCLSLAFSLYIR